MDEVVDTLKLNGLFTLKRLIRKPRSLVTPQPTAEGAEDPCGNRPQGSWSLPTSSLGPGPAWLVTHHAAHSRRNIMLAKVLRAPGPRTAPGVLVGGREGCMGEGL